MTQPMEFRPLGKTGLNVSVASLGSGGDSRLGQSTHGDRAESARLVRHALEIGINLIDTAPVYGDSERLLGDALRGLPRDSYILSTKVTPRKVGGLAQVAPPFVRRRLESRPPAPGHESRLASTEEITASCEESLRRLGTDYVDIFMFHGVTRAEYEGIRDTLYPAAARLREQGKVRFIGVTEPMPGSVLLDGAAEGSDVHNMVTRAANDGMWDVAMLKYGVLDQSADRVALPVARKAGMGILNMSPVRGAMSHADQLVSLLAEWAEQGLIDRAALPQEDPLGFLLHGDVSSVVAAGYRFVAENEAVSSVIVGTGNAEHLERNVEDILAGPLPPADSARLRSLFGHVTIERN